MEKEFWKRELFLPSWPRTSREDEWDSSRFVKSSEKPPKAKFLPTEEPLQETVLSEQTQKSTNGNLFPKSLLKIKRDNSNGKIIQTAKAKAEMDRLRELNWLRKTINNEDLNKRYKEAKNNLDQKKSWVKNTSRCNNEQI
ncbi:hypothetical protein JTB14_024828 [Gonioctena quinquepunctata]|nr:hypothetical protein JTB14_024828 [Gonioctena quinquepunctata]